MTQSPRISASAEQRLVNRSSGALQKKAPCLTWRPSPQIACEYQDVVGQLGSNDDMRNWAHSYVQGHAGRLAWDVDFLAAHHRFSNCLNVGGAPFLFEYLMARIRPDVALVTLDLDVSRFPRAGEILGTKVIQVDIERIDPKITERLGQFECVVFCEIFEHLRINILGTITSLASLVSPGGILYLTMPNGLGLSAWLTKYAKGRTGPDPVAEWRKLSDIGHMGHVREYSLREVRSVLEACGFAIDCYFFRRQSAFRGTWRSRIRDMAQMVATNLVPSLGDEIVVVARRSDSV